MSTDFLLAPEQPGTTVGRVRGVAFHRFANNRDRRGSLTAGEFGTSIPFTPRRYFIVSGVPASETRGEHAHKKCHQFLVCAAGGVSVIVDDGTHREEARLERPDVGLFIPAGVWGVQYRYSEGSVLLVFASEHYDSDDYIRNYDDFLRFRGVSA